MILIFFSNVLCEWEIIQSWLEAPYNKLYGCRTTIQLMTKLTGCIFRSHHTLVEHHGAKGKRCFNAEKSNGRQQRDRDQGAKVPTT
jgi:hypothetical protein